jgi:hypothetical protein
MKYQRSKSPYERSNPLGEKRKSLIEVLRNSLLVGVDLDISRQTD